MTAAETAAPHRHHRPLEPPGSGRGTVLPPVPRRRRRGLSPPELAEVDRRLRVVGDELEELALQLAACLGFGGRHRRQRPADVLADARQLVGRAQGLLEEQWGERPSLVEVLGAPLEES
jgi:hypothetical protein